MSTPKVGGHAFMREKAIPRYVGHYGDISKDECFVVALVEKRPGRCAVYLRRKDEERLIPAWRGDVKALPRCEYCDQEGHTKSKATTNNCKAMQRGGEAR